jgi:uncharacterized protein (DUF433 family)
MTPRLELEQGGGPKVVDADERRIDEPAYTPTAAARYLLLPVSTVRWWTLGNGVHPPVIRIADPHEHLLSFRNMVEVHVLSAVMRQDRSRVPIAIVRAVVAMLGESFQSEHPLADPRMREEGKDFFAMRFGALVNASQHGQVAIAGILAAYVHRIKRDERGEPRRLLIFTRGRPEGPEHIMIDPLVKSGEPCITDTELTAAMVAERFQAGESVKDLAAACERSPAEIEEAIRYVSEIA